MSEDSKPPPKKAKEPGSPAPVSRLRGGPGTFAGCNYQVKSATLRLLDWLLTHSADPSARGIFRCEPRVFPDTEHQFGFDYGLTGLGAQQPDTYVEAKLDPSRDEVVDLVASLQHLPAGDRPFGVLMVSATANVWFVALRTLYHLSRESTTDAELLERVNATANESDRSRLTQLLAAAGDRAWAHLQMLAEPLWLEESLVEERATWGAVSLAGSPAGGERLLHVLGLKLTAGFTERTAYQLAGVVEELHREDLLAGTSVTGPPDDAELAKIAVVLQVCPVPLPKTLLAQAMGVRVAELDTMVAPLLEAGVLFETENCLFRPDVKVSARQQSPSYAADLACGVLEALNAWAVSMKDEAYWQTLNAAALAQTYAKSCPEVAAYTFKVFDKAAKRWGDLGAVMKLAGASHQALKELLANPMVTRDQAHEWGAVRAQTVICGQSWVLQRVGQYERAIEWMRLAEKISKENHDAENEAFALKCEGRLLRMQSETLADTDAERSQLLQRSVELLVAAHTEFEALVPSDSRFVEDVGECVSLLARTQATAGNLVDAVREAARAEDLLAGRKGSKAYADLKVLQADLFLIEHDKGADPDVRAGHLEQIEKLLDRHQLGPDDFTNARASEVVARLHTTIARLVEPTDPSAAAEQFEVAAHLYHRLGYIPEEERNLLRARLAGGEMVPEGLQAALNTANAPDGARLRALDEYKRLSTATPASMKTEEDAAEHPVGDPWWETMVSEALAGHAAATTLWTDGQSA